jgi:hypothetical protein
MFDSVSTIAFQDIPIHAETYSPESRRRDIRIQLKHLFDALSADMFFRRIQSTNLKI